MRRVSVSRKKPGKAFVPKPKPVAALGGLSKKMASEFMNEHNIQPRTFALMLKAHSRVLASNVKDLGDRADFISQQTGVSLEAAHKLVLKLAFSNRR